MTQKQRALGIGLAVRCLLWRRRNCCTKTCLGRHQPRGLTDQGGLRWKPAVRLRSSIMSQLTFLHLNPDWNAEPNAPALKVAVEGSTVMLSFFLNPLPRRQPRVKSAASRSRVAVAGVRTPRTTKHGFQEKAGLVERPRNGVSSTKSWATMHRSKIGSGKLFHRQSWAKSTGMRV